MPVATIGLFALALVVIGLAFAVNKLVDNGGNDTLSPADTVRTQTAQKTQAAQGQTTQPAGQPTGATNQTPGANQTPGNNQTPANKTPGATTTSTGGGKTYVVQAGDTCGAIAAANNVTLAALEQANGLTDDTCPNIQVGQTLKIP